MSTARPPFFSEILKALREARGLSVAELGGRVGIPTPTLYAYEARRRGVPSDKAAQLRETLCKDSEEEVAFDESYAASGQVRGAMQEKFGSDTTTLHIADLRYAPFSGRADSFCSRFLEGILRPALIKIERPPDMDANPQSAYSFSMKDRMRWIEDGEADAIINLQHPMRMRKLKFLIMPIRISLNGVILIEDVKDIREARQLLVSPPGEVNNAFNVIAIENEVGHIFLRDSRQIPESNIEVTDSFDAQSLADQLQPGMRKLLVCDELTALAVVAAKDGAAILIYPTSSDQSVVHFDERQLPVHFLGFGVKRQNQELIGFLTEAIQNCVSTEIERVAKLIEHSYEELVRQVDHSFENNHFLYSGGIRSVSKYANPLPKKRASTEEKSLQLSLQATVFTTLITQSSRAFARHTLNISKRSVAAVPDELWAWRHVLNRARERVLISEARDRANVREIIISSMKSVLGIDPISNFDQSYQDYFKDVKDPEHWPDFRESLERELDITLPETLDPMHPEKGRAFWVPAGAPNKSAFDYLEWFVSAVQRAMEANTESTRLVSVKQIGRSSDLRNDQVKTGSRHESWAETFVTLWHEYCREALKAPDRELPTSDSIVLVAFSLGQAVGFIAASDAKFRNSNAIRVNDLFVTETMRGSGISRRLIRALIDTSVTNECTNLPSTECAFVCVPIGARESVKKAFEKSGFRKSNQDRAYFYRLYGLADTDPQALEMN